MSLPPSDNVRALRSRQAHDEEAERALLGALLIDPAAFATVRDLVNADDFYLRPHALIFAACCALAEDGEPIDSVMVYDRLTTSGELGASVPADLPMALSAAVGTAGNVKYYAKAVADSARVRRVQDGARAVLLHGTADGLDDFLTYARQRLTPALEPAPVQKVDPARKLLSDAIRRFTVEDLTSPPPRQEFLLWPYVPARTVTTLAGPGGANKTTFLVYLAVCRASGLPFFGGPAPRRGKTAIFTTEDNREDYWRKLAAARYELGDQFDAQAVSENVVLFDLPGVPVRLVEAEHGTFHPTPLADHLASVLRREVEGVDLVVVETVSRLAGGVETNESLSILVEAAQRVCRLAGVAVMLVAHVSQDAGRAGTADQYAPRGGSALGDNGRSTLVLTPLNAQNKKTYAPDVELSEEDLERALVLTHPKSNGAPKAKPLLLERISTPYGPALRPASPRLRQVVDPTVLRMRVLTTIASLARRGVPVSRRSLTHTYLAEIKCSRSVAERVIDDLVAENIIAETRSPKGGKGAMLVPLTDPDRVNDSVPRFPGDERGTAGHRGDSGLEEEEPGDS